jgi:perosamine synthetase
MPTTEPAGDHVYYVHALGYDPDETGVPSSVLVDALKAELPVTELREGEGPLVRAGYVQPVYNLPIFQARSDFYPPGLCPVTEAANQRLLIHEFMRPPMREADLDDVIAAFTKVLGNLSMLRTIGQRKTST